MKLSFNIIKIQKIIRGYFQRKYNILHGPALYKRELCINTEDFLTTDKIIDLPYSQFFSYTDINGFVYGFDIVSLYNLIKKSDKKPKNPYTRNSIPSNIIHKMNKFIKLSKLLKIPINLEIQDIVIEITPQKNIELQYLDLFQTINLLGNYSDPKWMLSLNRVNIIKFVKELFDIWNYRAQLTPEIKRNICFPDGDPFKNIFINIINDNNLISIQQKIIPLLKKFINSGIDNDSKSLGAYYVLGALTLVNESAAEALPWLYQSLNYI